MGITSENNEKIIVMDTSAFFAPARSLRDILVTHGARGVASDVPSSTSFITIDLAIFEFLKVIEVEIDMAKGKGNLERVKVLQSLKDRFHNLLEEFHIAIKVGVDFVTDDLKKAYLLISKGHESGDSMIWLKMQKLNLDTILTDDLKHWRSLGAKVLQIPHILKS